MTRQWGTKEYRDRRDRIQSASRPKRSTILTPREQSVVRKLRAAGYTQQAVAELFGVGQSTISALEGRGERRGV